MKHSTIAERRNAIAMQVFRDGSIKIKELADAFSVTTETIRKDLSFLEEKGLLKRSHGGALSSGELLLNPISNRLEENIDAKKRIAEKAFEFLPQKGIIFLDPGSTVFCLAKMLKLQPGLTIVTNALNVANILSDSQSTVYLTGGQVIDETSSVNGLWMVNNIGTIRIDVAFLGSSGVHNHRGPTSQIFGDAQNKRELLKSCNETVLLMDASKFETSAAVSYADWEQIDYIITDKEIPCKENEKLNIRKNVIVV